jgi:hypothetical protein
LRPYFKNILPQKRAGGVAQGVGPEFKLQYYKKKKRFKSILWSNIWSIVGKVPHTDEKNVSIKST